MSKLEEDFAGQLRMLFLEQGWDQAAIRREYQFCQDRRWRADFAIDLWVFNHLGPCPFGPTVEEDILLIEIEGGTKAPDAVGDDWPAVGVSEMDAGNYRELVKGKKSDGLGGRHVRHQGYQNDAIKYSAASALGYTVVRLTGEMVKSGLGRMMVEQILMGELEIEKWKA